MNSLDYGIISIFYTILYQIYAFIDFNEEFDPAHVERMLHNQKQDGGVGGSCYFIYIDKIVLSKVGHKILVDLQK